MTRTILIVDDDPMIRRLIATTLEDISGYRLQEAGDGLEAVEQAMRARPEIVFLDVDMPRLNGIETCRRLRSDPATASATIVMLTGDSGHVVERGAQDAGADLFLTKPFSPLHLLRLVDRIGAARLSRRTRKSGNVRRVAWYSAIAVANSDRSSPSDAINRCSSVRSSRSVARRVRFARVNASHERANASIVTRPP